MSITLAWSSVAVPLPTNRALDLELHMFEKPANHTSGSAETRRITMGLFDLLAAIRHLRGAKKTSRPQPT